MANPGKITMASGGNGAASHVSGERGHGAALRALRLEPLLDFGMRLGEGSGAALVVPLLQTALQLHAKMATFDEAGVAGKTEE